MHSSVSLNVASNGQWPRPENRRSVLSFSQGVSELRVAPAVASGLTVTFSVINRGQDLNGSHARSSLNILQRRLGRIIHELTVQDMNLTAARSQILDAGFAAEVACFTQDQIQSQLESAVLSQANLSPLDVLRLLS